MPGAMPFKPSVGVPRTLSFTARRSNLNAIAANRCAFEIGSSAQ